MIVIILGVIMMGGINMVGNYMEDEFGEFGKIE